MKKGDELIIIFFLFLMVLLPLFVVSAISSSNYNISNTVISDGAGNFSSENYKLYAIIGEIIGNMSSGSFNNYLGFWWYNVLADITPPTVHLILPANNTNSNTLKNTFMANWTDNNRSSGTLTLNIWNSTPSLINTSSSTVNGEWTYTGTNFSLAAQTSKPRGMHFDGTNWWIAEDTPGFIYKYFSNWTYTGTSYNVSSEDARPRAIHFDGTNFWMTGVETAFVYKYFSNWTYTGTSYDLNSESTTPRGIQFDGTNWWMLGGGTGIYKYFSNWTYTGVSFDVSSEDTNAEGIHFDGINWWLSGDVSNGIYKYSSDWTYTGVFYNLSSEASAPEGIDFDGRNWWMVGDDTDRVFKYNSSFIKWTYTFASGGTYIWNAEGCDNLGNCGFSEEGNYTLTVGIATPTPTLLSVDGTNQTAADLNCSETVTGFGGDLNVTVKWYKNNSLNLTIDFNNSYSDGTLFNAILGSGNTTKSENWICSLRLFDGTDYSSWGNSSNLTILNTLPTVTLNLPLDNNVTTNRTPEFSWNTGVDADNDALTYEVNINLVASSLCTDPDRNPSGISELSYVTDPYLACLIDNGDYYNWTVRANDGEGSGNWTVSRRIDIQAAIIISLPNNTVSFGSLNPNENKNTTDNNPPPFLLQNDGNAILNISVNATDLWTSITGSSIYFEYKIDNKSGEEGSFNWQQSTIIFEQMPSTTEIAIVGFNWSDSTDSAEIDLNVTVPPDESSGDKESTVYFTGSLGE